MAYDVGFFTTQLREQVFSPNIHQEQFDTVMADTGLVASRHAGPLDSVAKWLRSDLRKAPPSPPEEDIPWYRRQAERFEILAPHILDFAVLAKSLDTDTRRKTFSAFQERVNGEAQWPLRRGW